MKEPVVSKNNVYIISMKIAYLIRGISYINDYKNVRAIYSKDWRRCIGIFNKFKRGHDFDVFLHTYRHEHIDELIKDYKPVDYVITDFDDQLHPYYSLRNSLVHVLELFKKYQYQYDIVIVTRFDLFYKTNFSKMNITKPGNYFINESCEDNFIVLEPKNIDLYLDILNQKFDKPPFPPTIKEELRKKVDNYDYIVKKKGKQAAFTYYDIDYSIYKKLR